VADHHVNGARGVTVRALALVLASTALPAHAHLVETGFGAFYDGMAHVVLTPSDLLVVVALALLAGQRGTTAARWALAALASAWLAAGAIGAALPMEAALPVLTTLSFGLAGALVALNTRLPVAGVAALACAAGLVHGYVNGATMMPGGASALSLAGAVTAAFCLFTILSAQITTVRAAWGCIAVRVAGSWLSAAGILMLGWLARGT
jgi:hydrogenase/urease accessory protein HupE